MADKSFADLLREAGVQPSGAIQYAQSLNRPVPYRSYTPPRPLPRRMRPADVRAYDDNPGVAQQAMGEMRRDRMIGQDAMLREAQGPASNQFADAGMVALETTGVPALRRSYDAFEAGDPRQGIYEGIWGGLGLAGTLGAIPGARRGAPRLPTREPVLPQMREPPAPPPGSVLPVRPPQPFRQSLIGGADDLTGASRGVFSEGPPDGMPPRAPDAGAGRGTQLTREQAQARLQLLLDDAAKLEAETRATSQSIADMRDTASAAREQMRTAAQRMSEVVTPEARPAAPTEKLEFPQDPDQLRVFLERLRTEGPDALLAEQRARNAPDGGARGGEQFDTSRVVYRGLGRQYDPANGGYYQSFTSSLDDAREYGSNVVAAHIRPGRNLAVDGGGRNFNVLGVEQLPADVRARLHPSVGDTATTDQIAHAAREAGYDSVTVRNVHDNRWGERPIAGAEPRTIDFVFNTENIRPLDSVPPQATGPAGGEKVRLSAADRALLDDLLGPDAPTAGPSRPPPDTAKSYRPGPPKGWFFFSRRR